MRCISLLVVVASLASACAGRTEVGFLGSAAGPDPAGCYVLVFEQSDFVGRQEYINGPRKYATLSNLPFQQNWRQRIRSVQTGPRASARVWADEAFRGPSLALKSDAQHPKLAGALNGQIESLEIACQ